MCDECLIYYSFLSEYNIRAMSQVFANFFVTLFPFRKMDKICNL